MSDEPTQVLTKEELRQCWDEASKKAGHFRAAKVLKMMTEKKPHWAKYANQLGRCLLNKRIRLVGCQIGRIKELGMSVLLEMEYPAGTLRYVTYNDVMEAVIFNEVEL